MTKTKQQNKEKNTKDSLNYKGKVSVKLINNNRTVKKFVLKNEGKDALFRGICNYLVGNFSKDEFIPNKIDLRNGGTSILSSLSVLTSSGVNSSTEGYYAYFNSIITYSQISQQPTDWTSLTLWLVDEKGNDLASIEYPGEDAALKTAGLSITIQWQLYVYNASSEA